MKARSEPISVDPMDMADVTQVVVIDQLSFPLPWPASAYRRELLENTHAHFYVARARQDGAGPARWWAQWVRPPSERRVLGYVGFWYVVDEAHISTIAVHPDYRRHGIGERLLEAALRQAAGLGAKLATLEVRVGNLSAQRLYRKYGFEEVGQRKSYYRDNGEDALLMTVSPLAKAWEHAAEWDARDHSDGRAQEHEVR